jgi:1,4-alpha-glucan branching enzyme
VYAFSENYVLPLSHDEVTHGKGSLLAKLPGDDWQAFANLRLLYGYQFTQPGKKLLFMGGEFGQWHEWAHETSLEWDLLAKPPHRGLLRWVSDLNEAYRDQPALHELDTEPDGFQWVQIDDVVETTVSYLRWSTTGDVVLVAMNLTPVPRHAHTLGVPTSGRWTEILNSDAEAYGGSGLGNLGGVISREEPWGEFDHRIDVMLPPLGCVILKGPS